MNSEDFTEVKKILFYSENFCGEKAKGGLEVATYRVAEALAERGGWKVYAAYKRHRDNQTLGVYNGAVQLGNSPSRFKKVLAQFIAENEIDVVVNMTRFSRHKQIAEAAKASGRKVRVMFMQHFAPGSEMKKKTWKAGFHLLKLNPWNPLYWLRASVYPLVWLPRNMNWGRKYRLAYEASEKVILLSEGYFNSYREIAGISDDAKFVFSPNIFNREESADDSACREKKNRVLILSRMDEIQKRISLALKIWHKIEHTPGFDSWHLDIVGRGHDIKIMKRLARRLKLRNITFHGWSDRRRFLRDSKILMSTSEYEGLPLSLIEAQAYGCVPIAFKSYASASDIIDSGNNGVLVEKFGDTDTFVKELSALMGDAANLERLSANAMQNASRYSKERVGAIWESILKETEVG